MGQADWATFSPLISGHAAWIPRAPAIGLVSGGIPWYIAGMPQSNKGPKHRLAASERRDAGILVKFRRSERTDVHRAARLAGKAPAVFARDLILGGTRRALKAAING